MSISYPPSGVTPPLENLADTVDELRASFPMPSSLTPSERTLRARMAAHASHARHDPKERTQPARDKFDERFLDEVDPDRQLPEAERNRRATHARKSYFTGLALKSAKARRTKR